MKVDELEKQEIFAHFPTVISQEIVDYVTNVVLLDSRYIFTKRNGIGQQYSYCTHCKYTYRSENFKHNERVYCNKCNSFCTVKASGRGRKYLQDRGYFVWYDHSLKDKNSIVARGIYVVRDYSGPYTNVETKYTVTSMYLFEQGKSRMIDNYCWNNTYWRKRKSIISESTTSMQNIRSHYSRESIERAVKGTPFQYSTWEKYDYNEMLEFFDLASKYPCIEYLSKLGLTNLVKEKLRGHKTYSTINWRGKTLDKVLKLSKYEIKELKEIRDSNISLNYYSLFLFHQSKKDGSNFSLKDAVTLNKILPSYREDDIKEIHKYATLKQIIRYVKKQYIKKNEKHYFSSDMVIGTWKDYLRDCRELDMDLNKESILFPTNLYDAHQKTIKKIKYKADKALNDQLKIRLKKLKKYQFEYKGLIIRPALSIQELIDEGNALDHCVGSYAKRYAKGQTTILFIRKKTNPNKPFYTMEIQDNRIIQTYGFDNKLPTKQVQAFIDTFTNEILNNKRRERKIAV